ncbi:MAG: hypothetical protein RIS17_308, partial [Pseudomonadota bacterium]
MSDVDAPFDADAAAAAWDARLRSAQATDEDHRAFQAWLHEDPAHRDAYDRLQAALRALRRHADLPELSALRDEARRTVAANRKRRWQRRWTQRGLSIAASIAAIGLYFGLPQDVRPLAPAPVEQTFATTSEQRTRVKLDDGSLVTLDSSTRLAVRFAPDSRAVRLISGRALFRVAKDTARPFTVTAGDRTVTALGTVFDVRVLPREMRVTLAEGMVSVRAVTGPRAVQHILQPRQQLVAIAGRASAAVRTVDLRTVLAWADRQFFFEDEPLATAAEEINRSTDLTLVV